MKSQKFLWLILPVIFITLRLVAEVDPFYVEVMKEGENSYFNGQYNRAIKSFEVAEFGLYEEKKYLKELYLYLALSYYKLGRISEVQNIMKKMETELEMNISEVSNVPQNLKKDIEVMMSVTSSKAVKNRAVGKTKNSISMVKSFEQIFQQNLENLQRNQFVEVYKGIKKLRKINKRDSKIFYLKGLLAFKQKKYQDSIVLLKKYFYSKNTQYTDKVVYYLSLASYFTRDYGQCLAFYQKIKNPTDQKQMEVIIKKVLAERETLIQELVKNFNKKDLKKLGKTFAGDSAIGVDILKNALNYYQYNNPLILDIIKQCQRQSDSINPDFILTSAAYLEKVKGISAAIKIIEKSSFYSQKNKKNIEIFYRLGVLYYKNQKWDKALRALTIVNNLKQGYNDTEKIINEIKNKRGG